MALACLKVVKIVRRSDLHGTGSKLEIDQDGVPDNWNVSSRKRQADFLAHEVAIARIVRMHSHGGVAQHSFRTSSRDDQRGVWVIHYRITDVVELPLNIFMLHFDVG